MQRNDNVLNKEGVHSTVSPVSRRDVFVYNPLVKRLLQTLRVNGFERPIAPDDPIPLPVDKAPLTFTPGTIEEHVGDVLLR
ncbi:hypothetical protein Q1695_009485 [Nippostrongylus brasiliensis]|nr:hypothetical protein Q1695_009485 [Nippostrongylus brasiliensis]